MSSIDQKLKSQGLEPSKFEAPPTPNQTPQQEPIRKVELEPKVAVEKGPLFLSPTQIPAQEKAPAAEAAVNPEKKADSSERQQAPGDREEFPRTLVKGPTQPQPAARIPEQKRPAPPGQEDEPKNVIDQLKGDVENVGKVLNPFPLVSELNPASSQSCSEIPNTVCCATNQGAISLTVLLN